MHGILTVNELTKTFKLSSKRQRLERTNQKIKTAVNKLSFPVIRGNLGIIDLYLCYFYVTSEDC